MTGPEPSSAEGGPTRICDNTSRPVSGGAFRQGRHIHGQPRAPGIPDGAQLWHTGVVPIYLWLAVQALV